jgi:hypothetical protein
MLQFGVGENYGHGYLRLQGSDKYSISTLEKSPSDVLHVIPVFKLEDSGPVNSLSARYVTHTIYCLFNRPPACGKGKDGLKNFILPFFSKDQKYILFTIKVHFSKLD